MNQFIKTLHPCRTFANNAKTRFLLGLFFVCSFSSFAQAVATNSGSGLAATYPSLAAAITALNGATITAPITITLTGDETAPLGGYQITAQGTATNTITISGSSSTITAFTPQTTSSTMDAIFKLIGADFVTLENFTMQENASNTVGTTISTNNTRTEFGIALLYQSATNGCQNNTIQNNTISLVRTYTNTFGIYSNTRHTATSGTASADCTSFAGSNSFNKFYGNNISNVNYGITLTSAIATAVMGNGNDIGGASASTGNTITNWGGATRATNYLSVSGNNYCIISNNEINDNISFNTITSATNVANSILIGGILKQYTNPTTAANQPDPLSSPTLNINNNTITITSSPSVAAGTSQGINSQSLGILLPGAVHNIKNNTIQNYTIGGTTSTTGNLFCISNGSSPGTLNITGNTILNNAITATSATTGSVTVINNNGAASVANITNNRIEGCSTSGATGTVAGISFTTTAPVTTNFVNNTISNLQAVNSTSLSAINGILINSGATSTNNIFNNSVNIAATTSSASTFGTSAIGTTTSTSVNNLRNNIFVNTSASGPTGGFAAALRLTAAPTTTNFPATNNNNLYFAGAPSATKLIYGEGILATATNPQQAMMDYQNYISATLPATGREAASISVDPIFTSATNLLPTVCAVDNKGIIIPAVAIDFTGATKGSSTPDIGAFEINGVALGCDGSVENIWNGSGWSLGTPVATQKIVFEGAYSQNTDITGASYEVRNGAIVSIPATFSATASGPVVVTSGSLTFESNSNLWQTGLIANTGNITVKRSTAMQRLAYTFWGSPVAAQNLLTFSPATLPNRFATYSEATGAFVTVATPASTNFMQGVGYSIRAPNTFADAPAAAQTFLGSFTGVPNNGTITFPVTKSGNGDNLIGNPYPCTLSASSFFGANSAATALYFWTKSDLAAAASANYATRTLLTGTAALAGGATPSDVIQVGQGFFVNVLSATTITFNNTLKVINNADQFFRATNTTTNTIEKHLIKLNLTTPTANFNQIAVGYMTGATDGFDAGIDGLVFGGGNPTMISSLINGADYVIQGKALGFNVADVVTLGFRAETAGSYTISTAAMEGVFAGNQDFYIKDNLTGTIHNIKQAPYNFVSAAGTFNSRFQLVYQTVLGVSNPSIENGLITYVKNDLINIKATINMTDIKVYDLSGRLVYEKSKINTNAIELNDLKTEHQMLLIQITADGKTVTKKIMY